MAEPVIRPVTEVDVGAVVELYRAVYGDSFPYREFYDAQWIKKGVFDDDMVWVVAEHGGQLVGSAAVMLDVGDRNDLIGEFGRLAVHPDARGLGLGSLLLEHRVARAEDWIEFGFAECRTAHPGAQKIATRTGFQVVGFEPLAYEVFGRRESVVFVCRHFGNARRLRRNNPCVIPSAYDLASHALRRCGFESDVMVERYCEPYPSATNEVIEDLDDQQAFRLLRLSRGHDQHRLVFGGMKLEYGFLKLKAHAGKYLVLRRGETILGGLGYVYDDVDNKVRIFDLVTADDRTVGALLELGIAKIEAAENPVYVQVDVSAYEPRVQATLSCLGFAPVAFCPSMVFCGGERLDVLKMVKLRVPVKLDGMQLIEPAQEMADLVEELLCDAARGVEVDDIARRVRIFAGLTDVQLGRVRDVCREVPYKPGETVFERDSTDQALFIVLDGRVEIRASDEGAPLATISSGEIFGELALIDELPRSAGARATEASRLLVVRNDDFQALIRRDPEMGVTILRNIARTLSTRLRDTNVKVETLLSHKDQLLGSVQA